MSARVTVRSSEQLLAVVGQVLGFHPVDSIVIVGNGSGPTARLDAGPFREMTLALAPALEHWNQVVVVGYGTGQALVEDVSLWLTSRGLTVQAMVKSMNGADVGLRSHSHLDANPVAPGRACLEAGAAQITDVDEALEVALASYAAGSGARAWVYLDRAEALNGGRSPAMEDLHYLLTNAVDPRRSR